MRVVTIEQIGKPAPDCDRKLEIALYGDNDDYYYCIPLKYAYKVKEPIGFPKWAWRRRS